MFDVAIDRAGYQSKENNRKNCSSSFLRSFDQASLTFRHLWYSSLLRMLLTTTAVIRKHYFAGIRVDSRRIAGFTHERWTAFTPAQCTILQSPDFMSRVERALKITYLSHLKNSAKCVGKLLGSLYHGPEIKKPWLCSLLSVKHLGSGRVLKK